MGRGELRWSVADSAWGIEALRALRAEGKGVEEDPARCTSSSQSLKQLKVRTVTYTTTTATAPADHPRRHSPVLAGQRGGHGHGGGQSWGRGSEQTLRWGFAAGRGVRDRGGGAVTIEAAGRRVCMRGLGLSGVCVWGGSLSVWSPAPPGGQGFMLSLDAWAAGQGRWSHYTFQLLDHSPAIVHPPSPLPSRRGVSSSALFTSSSAVFPFQSVAVASLVPLGFIFLFPLAFARQVWGGRDTLLRVTELLQSATGFGRCALRVRPQQALPPVLWLNGRGGEFVSAFSVRVAFPHWALHRLRAWGGRRFLWHDEARASASMGRHSKVAMYVVWYLGPVWSRRSGTSWFEVALLLCSLVAAADPGECRAALFDWMDRCKKMGKKRKGESEKLDVYTNHLPLKATCT